MLRIYSVALLMLREAAQIADVVEKKNRDLADQLRRAATSVVLNIAEGSGSFGGNRRQRYHTAMGSAGEVSACYDCAEYMDYIAPLEKVIRERPMIIRNTLVNVLHLRR